MARRDAEARRQEALIRRQVTEAREVFTAEQNALIESQAQEAAELAEQHRLAAVPLEEQGRRYTVADRAIRQAGRYDPTLRESADSFYQAAGTTRDAQRQAEEAHRGILEAQAGARQQGDEWRQQEAIQARLVETNRIIAEATARHQAALDAQNRRP